MYVSQPQQGRGPPAAALVPSGYGPGEEAPVDGYEAAVDFPEGRQTVPFFGMRACCSGRELPLACWRQPKPSLPGSACRGLRLLWRGLCPAPV